MKSKLISALLTVLVSNTAFSAEYMMCFLTTAKYAKIKQTPLKCEVDDKGVANMKLDELVGQGWKVEDMSIVSETGGNFYTAHYLLAK